MSCNVQTRQEYRLSDADRQKIVSEFPSKIRYQQSIVPNSFGCQDTMPFEDFHGWSGSKEFLRQRMKFIARYGNDGVEQPTIAI